jgi:hypothetical protein
MAALLLSDAELDGLSDDLRVHHAEHRAMAVLEERFVVLDQIWRVIAGIKSHRAGEGFPAWLPAAWREHRARLQLRLQPLVRVRPEMGVSTRADGHPVGRRGWRTDTPRRVRPTCGEWRRRPPSARSLGCAWIATGLRRGRTGAKQERLSCCWRAWRAAARAITWAEAGEAGDEPRPASASVGLAELAVVEARHCRRPGLPAQPGAPPAHMAYVQPAAQRRRAAMPRTVFRP